MRKLQIGEYKEADNRNFIDEDAKSISRYLEDIGKYDLLSSEEEATLARRIKKGDKEALDSLVQANLRFVVSVAKQYQYHQGLSLADLIGLGNEGLIKAAKRFDETKGFKFTTYAVWRIRSKILEGLRNEGLMVRLPGSKYKEAIKVEETIQKFLQKQGRVPTESEIGVELGFGKYYCDQVTGVYQGHISLDIPVSDDEEENAINLATEEEFEVDKRHESTYLDMLKDTDVMKKELFRSLCEESLKTDIAQSLKHLSKRERIVITLCYGLEDNEEMTLEEIGEKLWLPSERVRQLKELALNKLRSLPLRKQGEKLKEYLG